MKKRRKKKANGTDSHTHSRPTALPLKLIIIEVERLDSGSTHILRKYQPKKGLSPTERTLPIKRQTLPNALMRLLQGGLISIRVEMETSIISKTTTD